MKKYVELAKKWLANNDSVSLEELNANVEAAEAAAKADDAAASWAAYWAAYRAARAARAAYWAAYAYWADDDTYRAAYCKQQAIEAIEKYEELTK